MNLVPGPIPDPTPQTPHPRGCPTGAPALVLVGIGTALVYALWAAWVPLLPAHLFTPLLDLGKITGYTWGSALRYCAIVAALFLLYGLGYVCVLRTDVGLPLVLGFMAVFGLALLFVYPATAADVFAYVAQGRLVALHHDNPFTTAPADHSADAVVGYLAFPREPTQYGPLWVALTAAISLVAGARPDQLGRSFAEEVLLYKALGAAALIIGSGLVYAVARRLGATRGRATAAAYVFGWNPLLLWEMVGNAHNDGLMVLGGLGACLALATRRYVLVLPALALGALVKVPVVALAPLLALLTARRSWRQTVLGALLAAALVAAAYAPFWVGPATLTFLQRGDLFTASLASCLMYLLEPGFGQQQAAAVARNTVFALLVVAVCPIFWRAWRARTDRDAVGLAYPLMLAVLLLGVTWFQAWYLVWPLALAAPLASAARDREVALLGLGGLGTYLVFIYLWVMGALPNTQVVIQLAAYAALVGPLLAGWLVAAEPHRGARSWFQTSPAR
jgi:hypothetical protein